LLPILLLELVRMIISESAFVVISLLIIVMVVFFLFWRVFRISKKINFEGGVFDFYLELHKSWVFFRWSKRIKVLDDSKRREVIRLTIEIYASIFIMVFLLSMMSRFL